MNKIIKNVCINCKFYEVKEGIIFNYNAYCTMHNYKFKRKKENGITRFEEELYATCDFFEAKEQKLSSLEKANFRYVKPEKK